MINFIFYHTPIFYLIQSVWRDEAFSFFLARQKFLQIITNSTHDFNPPFYYLLLHFWVLLVGKWDEILRLLSFFPHLATTYAAYYLAAKITDKKFAFFVAAFTFFNPMLIYYAFEMRMYSFYAFFAICSLYFLLIKNWRWYAITSILGLYTHSFFPLIIFSYLIYFYLTQQISRKNIILVIKPLIFFLPWLPVLVSQFFQSKNSWIFPVDVQLLTSVLGNLFTNYEGTPGNWWSYTAILSFFTVTFFIFAYRHNKKQSLLFLVPIFVPLCLILGYSILRRPIYVNRYMIFITVFEIIGISYGIWSIKNKNIRYISGFIWLTFVIFFNIIAAPYHKKTDFKSTFAEINKILQKDDFVYAKTPIGFLESAYYSKNTDKTFLYNPNNITIPYYIGITVVFPDISQTTLPTAPSRTFLVNDDASYELIINR